MKRFIFAAAVTISLASCGPIYQTNYRFIAPEAPEGKACVFQCDNLKLRCRQVQDLQTRECETQARYDREICERQIQYEHGRAPKWHECGTSYCSSDYESCEGDYRACYGTCGGQVDAQTVCVANCEQAVAQR